MSAAEVAPPRSALERLLRPRSVAIVGASPTPGSLGAAVIANLDRLGFAGDVHLINPNRDRIGTRACLRSAEQLPHGVDAAVLAIPRDAVLETVAALAQRGVGAAIIFSAGFAEGGVDGVQAQRALADIARRSGMAIEGPNCLGLVNYVDRVALTFVETPATALGDGPGIGIVSQSGAMAAVLGVMLSSRHLGLSYSISTGNEAVCGVEDFLEQLLGDGRTRVIGMIVEQFRRPRRFLELARRAREQGMRIVLLHPGRGEAARRSAATHTGAMASDHGVMRTLVEREGVILAGSLEELSDVLELALRCPAWNARGPAVATESGAFKALTLDLCEQIGLDLPPLGADTVATLRRELPHFIPLGNPLDLTAQALVDPDLYRRALAALLGDERFGSILFTLIQTDATTSALKFPPLSEAIAGLAPSKPVIVAGMDEGAAVPAAYIDGLRALGVPYLPSPERALRAISRLVAHAQRDLSRVTHPDSPPDWHAQAGIVPEYRAKQLLAPLGIAFPRGRLARTLDEALRIAAEVTYPVALKAQSAALSHKSDAGGVLLHIADDEQLTRCWHGMAARMAEHLPDTPLDGVLVEKMSAPGLELVVGGRNDRDWGPVVLVGLGGVQAELLGDVRLLATDLTPSGIAAELSRLRLAPLLHGYRGSAPLDVAALIELITRVCQLLRFQPRLREIDLNPVVLGTRGVVALDALMLLDGAS